MIRDRGHIKWTSLMLPRHKQMLAKLYDEQDDVKQPILDEQKLEELGLTIHEALNGGQAVQIDCFHRNRIQTIFGKITKCDAQSKTIQVVHEEQRYVIDFHKIINVSLL